MRLKPFKVEQWMNEYEMDAVNNIAETCVDSISLKELLRLTGTPEGDFFKELSEKKLTYGYITGNPDLKNAISGLYKNITSDDILTTNGGIGANNLILQAIVDKGDKVVSIIPTYQQLYSIPESIGADVTVVYLEKDKNYLPDMEILKRVVDDSTKLIALNNPNNPTGAIIPEELMKEIVELARKHDAYVLCDEVYRGLNQDGSYQTSIADLYEKGIGTSSMSKVFSLAGLRLGWIVTKNIELMKKLESHRDYSIISCGMLDEIIAAHALRNKDKLLERNLGIIKENLEILDNWIKEHPGFSFVKPKAGTTALVYYDFDINSYDFCIGLMEHSKTLVTPGDCFEYEKSFRIGYAASKEVLIKGLEMLADYSEKIK